MICNYFPEPAYLFFTSEVPELLYYSHFTSIVISLLIGVLLFVKSGKNPAARALFALTLCFSAWTFINLISWTNIQSDFILFAWSLSILLQSLMSIFAIYFMRVYITQRDTGILFKSILLLLVLPVLILAPTNISVSGLNISDCDAFMFEGYMYQLYYVFLSIIAMLWVLVMAIQGYRAALINQKRQLLLMGIGVQFFLFTFFTIVFLAQYFTVSGVFDDSRFEMYGLFGMTFFMAVLGYLIVKYQAFNIKMLATQALVIALILLVGSLAFFETSRTGDVIVGITFVLACIGGFFLVRSVKKEVQQREQLEELTQKLEAANERLKELDKMKSEFVSIASHQLRSPITAIRGYISMLTEGSYGKFPDKAREVLDRVAESSKFMASSIEDYLNVSRIEAGNMKYELSDFNLKEQAERVTDELRQVALKKGLVLLFRSDVKGSGMVHADIGKARQVIMNFVDNSIKYTPKGTITVIAHDDPSKKKMWVTIHDTGIGMSKETLAEVFDKFVRAKNANQVNVTGTGLGLYVAKKMASGMGGKVWAESEGEGKGSSFYIEFPELPGNPSK